MPPGVRVLLRLLARVYLASSSFSLVRFGGSQSLAGAARAAPFARPLPRRPVCRRGTKGPTAPVLGRLRFRAPNGFRLRGGATSRGMRTGRRTVAHPSGPIAGRKAPRLGRALLGRLRVGSPSSIAGTRGGPGRSRVRGGGTREVGGPRVTPAGRLPARKAVYASRGRASKGGSGSGPV